MRSFVVTVIVGALFASAGAASAQTLYRYVDKNGKVHYSDKPLTDLAGRPVDQLSRSGSILRHTPAPPTAEERAAIEEEKRRTAAAQKAREVEQRRDVALLTTYSSAKEVEDAHAFAVREPQALVRDAEAKLAAAVAKRDKAKAALAAAKGGEVVTAQRDATAAEIDVKSFTELLAAKRREVQTINERFDEDKRRYSELVRARTESMQSNRDAGGTSGAVAAGSAAPSSAMQAIPKR